MKGLDDYLSYMIGFTAAMTVGLFVGKQINILILNWFWVFSPIIIGAVCSVIFISTYLLVQKLRARREINERGKD